MSETSEVKARTYRAFDTEKDARTFQKFIEAMGFENIALEYISVFNLWRVWFNIKFEVFDI